MASNQEMNSSQYEYIPRSRQKAQDVSKSLSFFGKEIVSPETIEKVREPTRKALTEFGASALAAPSSIVNLVMGIVGAPEKVRKYIPTAESFKKTIEGFTGEGLNPSNYWESVLQDVSGRAGTIAGLGGARSPISAVGVPVAGTAVKKGLEYGGAPPWLQATGTLITDFLLGARDYPNVRQAASNFHKLAEQRIPQGHFHDSNTLLNELRGIVTKLSRGGKNPETAPVLSKAEEMIATIGQSNGMVDPRELYAMRTAVNAMRGDPQTLEGGKKWFDALNNLLNRELTSYGKTQNPQFLKALNEGDKLVIGFSNSRKAVNFLRAKVPDNLKNNPVAALAMFLNPKAYLTGLGITKAAEIGHRLLTSSAIRRHYGNAIRFALKGDAKGAVHTMKMLDKEVKKDIPQFQEGKFEFIPHDEK